MPSLIFSRGEEEDVQKIERNWKNLCTLRNADDEYTSEISAINTREYPGSDGWVFGNDVGGVMDLPSWLKKVDRC